MIYKLQFKIFLHGSPSDIVEDIIVNLATISISLFSNGSWENLFITQRRLKITVERKLLPNFFLSSKLFMFENQVLFTTLYITFKANYNPKKILTSIFHVYIQVCMHILDKHITIQINVYTTLMHEKWNKYASFLLIRHNF